MITEALKDHPKYLEFADALITLKLSKSLSKRSLLSVTTKRCLKRYRDPDTVAFLKRLSRDSIPEVLLEITWREFNAAFG